MKEIFDQAQQEFAGVGVLTLELPKPSHPSGQPWPMIEPSMFGFPVFHFGIRWHDSSEQLNVVTYGPKPVYERINGRLTKVAENDDQYVCWAS